MAEVMDLKQLRENFIKRDSDAVYAMHNRYGYGITPHMEYRIEFAERRLLDLCEVVVDLIQILEAQLVPKENNYEHR